jgi:hypothetical protein
MRTILIPLLLALLAIGALAADVSGAWKGSMETPMGKMDLALTLKADGPSPSGTMNFMGNDSKVEKLVIDGSKISFELNMEFGTMVYAGTIEGNTMNLKMKVMSDEVPVVLKRSN